MSHAILTTLLNVLLSLSPVFLFLFLFLILDNLRLVRRKILLFCLGWGILSASLSYLLNTWLIRSYHFNFDIFSQYVAPVVEEVLKMTLILILARRGKMGFMIDGAIYGFTIGAAFSLTENIYYLFEYSQVHPGIMTWITRGFGTAVMHGGTTAVFAILIAGSNNRMAFRVISFAVALLSAILIHAIFNYLTFYPAAATLFIIIVIPLSLVLSFHFNEQSIRRWMESEFDSELSILTMIRKGEFSSTRTGQYLQSIKLHFTPEMVVDMYCYITLYTELSLKAKSIMMLKENDIMIPPDPSLKIKLEELGNLRRMIGRTGYLAISPVLKMNRKDVWKLTLLSTN